MKKANDSLQIEISLQKSINRLTRINKDFEALKQELLSQPFEESNKASLSRELSNLRRIIEILKKE